MDIIYTTYEDSMLATIISQLRPNLKEIEPILVHYWGTSQYNKEIKFFKKDGGISVPFLSLSEAKQILRELDRIVDGHGLADHKQNLFFIIIGTLSLTVHNFYEGLIPVNESTKRVKEFIENFKQLVENKEKDFSVTISEKVKVSDQDDQETKKIRIKFNDTHTSAWIVDTLINAFDQGQYPISLGSQLLATNIESDPKTGKKIFVSKVPREALITRTNKEIEAMIYYTIAMPILTYLEVFTVIKKLKAERWSFKQLGIVLEILVALDLFKSNVPTYKKSAVYKPSKLEKDMLDKLLSRQFS